MATRTIKLLNKTYEIKCLEQEFQNLEEAATKLNESLLKYHKQFPHLSDFQNLLLGALQVSHDLITTTKQQEQQQHQVKAFINSLEDKIFKVMNSEIN